MNEPAGVPHVASAKIPVTLITGPLGAGKSTLLDRILKEPHGLKFAAIVNEFGEIGIDQELIAASEADTVELINGGCGCCARATEFSQTLLRLAQRRDFDAIVVETSGVSDPMSLARAFIEDHAIALACELDAVVAVLDGRHGDLHRADRPALNQVALADVLIVNKTDVAAPRAIAELDAELRRLNSHAVIHQTVRCDVPIAALLGRHSFDLDRIEDSDRHFASHSHESHDVAIGSLSLASEGAIDPERFFAWIGPLIGGPGGGVLRSKGILAFPAEPRRFVFQSVDSAVDGAFQRNWRDEEKPNCRLVLIGPDLDQDSLIAGFRACTQERVDANAI